MKTAHIIFALLCIATTLSSQPTIPNPAQRDTIFLDLGTPNQADPGDKIRYKVTIQNTGSAAATMAQIMAGLDPRTTFIPGSFRTSPLATPDAYAVTANVGINVPDGAGDLLSNDFDDNLAGLTLTAGTFTTAMGGSIMISANGSFMYTPPAGLVGTDTYSYTLNDGNAVMGVTPTDLGLITFTMSNLIYFIDNASVAATSDGRLTSPYKTLADFNAGSTAAASVIYINHTGTNYTGGIVLANGERLFGEGHTGAANLSGVLPFALAPNSKTLPNINGSRPVIENAGGDGILLASNNTIRGLNVGASTDMAIDDNGSVGTLTISELLINNISGGGIRADNNGTLAVTIDALTATGGPHAVNLNSTGGTFTITGATNANSQTSDAVILAGVSATVSFGITNITPTGALQAIEITNNTGAISFASGTVGPGSTAEEVLIHQGNANIILGCTVTGNSGSTIKITGRTGGTIDFTNSVTHNAGANGIVIGTSTAGENNSGGTIQFSGPSKGIASSGAFTGVLMTNNTGATINFINGGLNIDCLSAGGVGMSITGGGSLTVSGNTNTIDVQPGIAFLNSGTGGNATIDVNAALTSSSGKVVDIQNRTGGNVTLSGNMTSVGAGILVNANSGGTILFSGTSKSFNSGGTSPVNLTSNTGTTINFTNGGLVITTSTGVGFNATGGAAGISVQGSGNTINSTNATALNVANTNINSGNLNFLSISSGNNDATADPANGITLNTTGASGGLIISGTGTTDGSGGTIQNTTGRGASFISGTNITLKNMNFTNASSSDLDATNGGLSTGDNLVTNASIHLQTITTATLDNLNITGGAEQGINGNTVSNFTFNNSTITNAGNEADEDGIHFFNMSGTCMMMNTTITCTVATPNTTGGDDHMNLQTTSGTLNLTITGGSATNANKGSGYLFGIRGSTNATINFSGATSSSNFSGGIVADAFENAIMNLTVNSSTSSGNNDQLSVSAGDNSQVELIASGNTLSSPNNADFVAIGLLGSAFDTGYKLDANINNNTITIGNGLAADGIVVNNAGGAAINVAITGNTFHYAGTQRVILLQAGTDGNGTTNATVTGNNIDIELDGTGNAVTGILAQSAVTGPGNTSSLCVDIGGAGALSNTFTHSIGGSIAGGDIRVRQRNDGTMRLPGYANSATDMTLVANFLNGRNAEVSPSTATADSSGFAGGAACTQP